MLAMVPFVLNERSKRVSAGPAQTILRSTWIAFGLCLASYLLATLHYGLHDDGALIGAYQCARLLQFIVVIFAVTHVEMDLSRWKIFRWVSLSAFCLISAGLIVTSLGVVDASLGAPLLPASPLLAGPWGSYAAGGIQNSGFIGYNHAYAGAQLILSAGIAYLCFEGSKNIRLIICLFLLFSTFASGSRASLIVAVMLVLALEWGRTNSNLFILVLFCVLGFSWSIGSIVTEDAAERQASSISSFEDDGLAGRTDIWQEHIDYFTAHPMNVLFGTGYGYNGRASSSNAHMLYLHVLTETGLAGLLFFLYLQKKTLLLLRAPDLRAVRLTVWALLFSGLTQETIYPTAALTHFVGYYLCALVIALRFGGRSNRTLFS
jgi:O-antigen ligase